MKTDENEIMNPDKQQFTCLLTLITLFVFPLSAQQKLTLDVCRTLALEQNRKFVSRKMRCRQPPMPENLCKHNIFPK